MASGCPFAARKDPKSVSMCPFASKLGAGAPAEEAAAPKTCPLGFGSARGPRLSTLHCPVCKGLLFDAHKVTSCQHTFCRSCISQTQDCPSCGRDVDGLEPNPELAGVQQTQPWGPCLAPMHLLHGRLRTCVWYLSTRSSLPTQ